MGLLKKENWLVCLILTLISDGIFIFILGAMLDVYDRKAWYANYKYWLLGVLCAFAPAVIMLAIFTIQITVEVCKKLDVPGSEIYAIPYTWILCLIVPVIGWILFIVMLIYVTFWPCVMIYRGNGEKYLK